MSNKSYGTFYDTADVSASSKQSCPFTRNSRGGIHEYRAPRAGDTRSVCPALNTMANHGYIPRDGRRLTFMSIYSGLKGCYGLSTPLAMFLTLGGFFLIKRLPIRLPFGLEKIIRVHNPDGSTSSPGELDLHHVGLHNGVEHDASLVHLDAKKGELYPPTLIVDDYMENLVGDILPKVRGYSETHLRVPPSLTEGDSDSEDGLRTLAPSPDPSRSSSRSSMTIASGLGLGWHKFTSAEYRDELVSAADVGRMRFRREQEIAPKKMDKYHAEIARGEMAIILGVWEETHSETKKMGVPLPYLLTWLGEERLPEDWEPKRTQGLLDVVRRAKEIRTATEGIQNARL